MVPEFQSSATHLQVKPILGLESQLAASWPPPEWADSHLLLAVSGGADSVAMLCALVRLKAAGQGRLAVAHLHHGLRGSQSDDDEAFVRDLCRNFDLPLHVSRVDCADLASRHGDGLEAASRAARYHFLRQTARHIDARYVATAHTADDQAETILHRLMRGTGLSGLAGIPRSRPLGHGALLVRPMLDFRRSEVIDYLNTLGQPFRVDRSNRDTRFTRNAIRHQLLPLLVSRFNPHAVDSIVRLGRLAGEAQQVIDSLVTDLRQRCVSQRPVPEGSISQGSMSRSPKQALAINCHALAEVPPYLVRELVRAAWREQGWRCQSMGYAEWDKLAQWIHDPASAPRRYALPGNIGMDLRGDEMLLAATSAARRSAT